PCPEAAQRRPLGPARPPRPLSLVTHPGRRCLSMAEPVATPARNPVERLAEEFVRRAKRGERPSLTEYLEKYPDQAAEIRELFPIIALREQVKPAVVEPAGPPAAAEPPGRLGEFRILREVGRGGMGVVYEAIQEPLNRRVALKVMSRGTTT